MNKSDSENNNIEIFNEFKSSVSAEKATGNPLVMVLLALFALCFIRLKRKI